VTCKIIQRQQTTRNIVCTHFMCTEVKQRVELYVYSPSGPSWHVVERTFIIVTGTFVLQFHVSVEHSFCIYQSVIILVILVKMGFTFFYQKKNRKTDWLSQQSTGLYTNAHTEETWVWLITLQSRWWFLKWGIRFPSTTSKYFVLRYLHYSRNTYISLASYN